MCVGGSCSSSKISISHAPTGVNKQLRVEIMQFSSGLAYFRMHLENEKKPSLCIPVLRRGI